MHTFKHNLIYSAFCKINIICLHADQNIAEVFRTIWKVNRTIYRLLSGYCFNP